MTAQTEIRHAAAAIWDNNTVNTILTQLRTLPGMLVVRDNTAGTFIAKRQATGREYARGLKAPYGWIVRYDTRLIEKK